MTDSDEDKPISGPADPGRRETLKLLGGVVTAPFGIGTTAYSLDRSYEDADSDAIPDSLEGSEEFTAWLTDLFGVDQFEGFDPDRRDLLVDIRYVGATTVSERTKTALVELFRSNGIYLQWLDYPERYDRAWFERRYGYDARRILWSPWSFYHRTVERRLKNVALQLVVVPGFGEGPHHGRLYSPWTKFHTGSGYVSGLSTGNRAVVADRQSPEIEAKLILHEIAHYAVCHSTDPENTGVMGTNEKFNLMAHEWEALRTGLGSIRDTTGFDVAFQRCLWAELQPSMFGLPDQLDGRVDCDGCRPE
ncbi:hypothetical protein halTADL_0477 [Halohasta litchfieldiae]|uniref:Uncharacterized protein n=1 Tax=Halohasta litchfieldiae TaxID=1073996 RepID=A0A1H6X7F2_9EURY|nr:hypothetical protein [Halohasta litchfieldiae]ATW87290.1 hypothetical protein halTADL_0477 [Halohasta litchfieldiae]SEJ23976.1 hypothetical protein SAMN05444271_13414 [Halohasta litchfieldiae]